MFGNLQISQCPESGTSETVSLVESRIIVILFLTLADPGNALDVVSTLEYKTVACRLYNIKSYRWMYTV